MQKIHSVQELRFDGARLFCPKHPQFRLFKGFHDVRVFMLCLAPGPHLRPCMRSAQWATETGMREELIKLALERDA